MQTDEAIVTRIERIFSSLTPLHARPGDGVPATTLAERMAFYGVPGVSIALIAVAEIVHAQGFGVRDAVTQVPVTPEMRFQAASISKIDL